MGRREYKKNLLELDLYDKDENGNRIPHHFGNENGILDLLKINIKKYDNFLFVASVEDNPEATDMYAGVTIESFKITLPFKEYKVLDGRTMNDAKKLIEEIAVKKGVPSTCGIGTNMFLAKIALDITAKNSTDHISYLNEDIFKEYVCKCNGRIIKGTVLRGNGTETAKGLSADFL